MDLKYLQTFRTIVETGSFTSAAEKLNYTQSTITFQIKQLEQELSVQLFEKLGRKMVLTKAGENLIPYVDEVMRSLDKLRSFESNLSQCRGDLHIGVGETLLCYKVPAILKEFHRQAPNARLFLRSMNCYDIRNELCSGMLDLGLLYEDIGGFDDNLTAYSFGKHQLALVAAPKAAKICPDFTTSNKSIALPFIINEPRCVFRLIFEEYLRQKSIVLDHTIELWSVATIKNLVLNEVGFSFLPKFTVADELSKHELVEIPTDMPQPQISAVVAHHKNKWLSPLMQCFIELCQKAAADFEAERNK